MGVKRPLDFRFPELEHSYTQGGFHECSVPDVWQEVMSFTNKRGTMYVRSQRYGGGNWFSHFRITLDGVEYPIQYKQKAGGENPFWIFDFNESIKIEHKSDTYAPYLRVEYAYCEYRP